MRKHGKNIAKKCKPHNKQNKCFFLEQNKYIYLSSSIRLNFPFSFCYLILASAATYRCAGSDLQITASELDIPIWWNYNISGGNVVTDGSLETSIDYNTELLSSRDPGPTMLYLAGNPYDNPNDGFKMSDTSSNLRMNIVVVPSDGEIHMVIPQNEQAYQGSYDFVTGLDYFAIANSMVLPKEYEIFLTPLQLSYLDSLYFVPSKNDPSGDYDFVFYLEELDPLGDLIAVNIVSAQLSPDNMQPTLSAVAGQEITPGESEVVSEVPEGEQISNLVIANFNVLDIDNNPGELSFSLFYRSANSMVLIDTADIFFISYTTSQPNLVQVELKSQSQIDYENNYAYLNIEGDSRFFQILLVATDPISHQYIINDDLSLIDTTSKFGIRLNIIDKNEFPILVLPSIDLGNISLESEIIVATELLSLAFSDNDGNAMNNQIDSIFFTFLPSDVLISYIDSNNNETMLVLNEHYSVSSSSSIKISPNGVSGSFTAAFGVADSGTPSLASIESTVLNFIINSPSDNTLIYSIDENNPQDSLITTLTATDFSLADTVSYRKITSMDDSSFFNIDTVTGALSFIMSVDYELPQNKRGDNIYRILIEATDSNGNHSVLNIHLSINNLGDNIPVFVNPIDIVYFSEGYIGLIADIDAYDPDSVDQRIDDVDYSLSGSPAFMIDTLGNIVSTSALSIKNLGETVSLTITASDSHSSSEHVLQLNIEDVNEVPVLVRDSTLLDVLTPASSLYVDVATLTSAFMDFDLNAPNNLLTYISFFDIPSGIVLNIDANGLPGIIVEGERYELNNLDGIRIELSDNMLSSALYSINFKLIDGGSPIIVPEASSKLLFSVDTNGENFLLMQIDENNNPNAVIASLNADNFELDNILSYRMQNGFDSQYFEIMANGDLSFKISADYEQPLDEGSDNSYNIQIDATDTNGSTSTLNFTLFIKNINDNPPVILNTIYNLYFDEGYSGLLIDIDAYDPDLGMDAIDEVEYSLSPAPAYFSINTDGEIFVTRPLDRETLLSNNPITFDIIVEDSANHIVSETIYLDVGDINEAPFVVDSKVVIGTLRKGGMINVDKSRLTSAFVDTDLSGPNAFLAKMYLNLIDLPLGFEVSADIGGVDQLLDHIHHVFDIDSFNYLRFQIADSAPIVPGLYSLDYGVIDGGSPELMSPASQIIFAVSPASENTLIRTIDENNVPNVLIYSFQASDFILDTVSEYHITGGIDSAKFSIDSNTGEIFLLVSTDHEAPTDFDGDNIYQVQIEARDIYRSTSVVNLELVINNLEDSYPVFLTNHPALLVFQEFYSGIIADFDAYDPDKGISSVDALTYGLYNEDRFTIDSSGIIFTRVPLHLDNFGSLDTVTIHVTASDSTGFSIVYDLNVQIIDVNEPPSRVISFLDVGSFDPSGSLFVDIETLKSAFVDDDPTADYARLSAIVFDNIPDGITIRRVFENIEDPFDLVEGVRLDLDTPNGRLSGFRIFATTTASPGLYSNIGFSFIDGFDLPSDEYTRLGFVLSENNSAFFVDIDENNSPNIIIKTLIPEDFGLESVTSYRISGGVDDPFFEITPGSNELIFRAATDYEFPSDINRDNIYEIEIEATGNNLNKATISIFVSINNVNDIAPEFLFFSSTVLFAENMQGLIMDVTAFDPDKGIHELDNVDYFITGNSAIIIDENGNIIASRPFDYETMDPIITLMVVATDGFFDTSITITLEVLDVNEAPRTYVPNTVATLANGRVSQDAGGFYDIASFVSRYFYDPDINDPNAVLDKIVFTSLPDNNILRYSTHFRSAPIIIDKEYEIENANADGSLYIPTGSIDGSYRYIFHVIDAGLPALRSEDVLLSFDIVSSPDFLNNYEPLFYRVREDITIADGRIATIIALDALSYSITGGADMDKFNVRQENVGSNIAAILLLRESLFYSNPVDSDMDNVYEVELTATGYYGFSKVNLLIEVLNLDSGGPYFVNLPNYIFFDENTRGVIFDVNSYDPDYLSILDYPTYELTGDSRFVIDSDTGEISVIENIDFDTSSSNNNIIPLYIQITSDGMSYTRSVILRVLDTNDNVPRLSVDSINLGIIRQGFTYAVDISKFTYIFTDDDYGYANSQIASIILLSIPDNILLSDANNNILRPGDKLSVADLPYLFIASTTELAQAYDVGRYGSFAIYYRVEDGGSPALISEDIGKLYVDVLGPTDLANMAPTFIYTDGMHHNSTIRYPEGFITENIIDIVFFDQELDFLVYNISPEIFYQGDARFTLKRGLGTSYQVYAEINADYEAYSQYEFTLSINDGRNLSKAIFTIVIEDVNETPVLKEETITVFSSDTMEVVVDFSKISLNFEDPDGPSTNFGSLSDIEIIDFEGSGSFNYRLSSIDAWIPLLVQTKYSADTIGEIGYLSGTDTGRLQYKLYDNGSIDGDVDLATPTGSLIIEIVTAFKSRDSLGVTSEFSSSLQISSTSFDISGSDISDTISDIVEVSDYSSHMSESFSEDSGADIIDSSLSWVDCC